MASPKSNIRPLWFVSQLGIAEDQSKPRPVIQGTAGAVQQEELAPAPAQPRRRDAGLQLNIDREEGNSGYGFAMLRPNVITFAFTTEQAAKDYATDLAAKNPQTTYGVFGCIGVVETTRPQVIEKKFNDSGELILLEKADGQDTLAS